MTPVFKLARNDIGPSIRRYAAEMKKGLPEVTKSTAKGVTRRVIDVTPPASAGVVGAAARRAGFDRIASDMGKVLAPVRLKGRRKITTVFGHTVARPFYVPTRELHPDVAGAYRQHRTFRNNGVGVRARNLRERKLFVDERKFAAVLKAKQARVGALASGWTAAAQALDVPVQQWISRHGTSGGRIQIDTAGDRMRVTVENFAPGVPENVRAELARRIPYAVEYQAAAMARAIAGYHNRTKQELGLKGAVRPAV